MVVDDYGNHVLYDCVFEDMRTVEQHMLQIASFYINKVEPVQEAEMR